MLLLSLALSIAIPADTTTWVVLNHGRPAGEMRVTMVRDSVLVKYHYYDRQRGSRIESRYRIENGVLLGGETWQLPLYGPEPTPRPLPTDRFEVVRDSFLWTFRDSTRRFPRTSSSYYRLRSATPFDQLLLAKHLLRQPRHTATLVPTGTSRLEIVSDTTLRTRTSRQRVRLAMMYTGNFPVPVGIWLDPQGDLVATQVGWFITVRKGSEDLLPAMRSIELAYRDKHGAELARRLAPTPSKALAIVNGDVFDSERAVMLPKTTVLIRGERIAAVGPAGTIQVPADATVIDATGKTVMPGMYDMHGHVQHTTQSTRALTDLASGITTVRDMAADIDVAVSHRNRSDAGLLASPRLVLGGFIEGPGHWAGPSEVIVTTEQEARSWIARYDSLGYRQIKLYNLVQQDLVPAIADETHKRGMILSGHVPRGLTTQTAVRLGFDEINHAAFLFSTFFQDSLYTPTMRAYSGVAQIVAPNVNVDGPEVTEMIELFKEKGTVIDGTWQLWLSQRGANPGLGIPAAATRAAGERADSNYLRMLMRLYQAGVPLVAGTDGSSYNGELELYERAGIPAPQVLRIATLVPARVLKEEREYGSIAVGKIADIMIVDGKPAERVADLRKVERVIRAGRMYDSAALRTAVSGAPAVP
jgi:imidazolonepropionase-like amidohydrolase